jgi:hypothetical protein
MQYLHPIAWAIAEDREREIRRRLLHAAWLRGRVHGRDSRTPRRLGAWPTWSVGLPWTGKRRAPGTRG